MQTHCLLNSAIVNTRFIQLNFHRRLNRLLSLDDSRLSERQFEVVNLQLSICFCNCNKKTQPKMTNYQERDPGVSVQFKWRPINTY